MAFPSSASYLWRGHVNPRHRSFLLPRDRVEVYVVYILAGAAPLLEITITPAASMAHLIPMAKKTVLPLLRVATRTEHGGAGEGRQGRGYGRSGGCQERPTRQVRLAPRNRRHHHRARRRQWSVGRSSYVLFSNPFTSNGPVNLSSVLGQTVLLEPMLD